MIFVYLFIKFVLKQKKTQYTGNMIEITIKKDNNTVDKKTNIIKLRQQNSTCCTCSGGGGGGMV